MCVSLKPNIQSYVIMNWKILNQPLGMTGSIGIPERKMAVPLAVPLVMAGGSILSSIFGGNASQEAAEEARRQQLAEKRRLEAERLRKTNENYIDTAAGQNMLRVARMEADKIWRRESGAAKVAGGTDAATALAKEQGNRMVGDTIANIAAQDTARKDNIDARYSAEISRVNQGIMQSKMDEANAVAQAAGGVSSALMQGALQTFGGTKLGQSWFGTGSPGGGGVNPAPVKSYVKSITPNFGNAKIYNPYIYQAINGWGTL